MFDFTHLREITSKMQVESLAYAKNFWQKIFDSLDFDEKFPVEDFAEIFYSELPDEVDPLSLFKGVCLNISYSCYGDIKIEIKWDEEEIFNESHDRILKAALIVNGFTMSSSYDNLYSCNINET